MAENEKFLGTNTYGKNRVLRALDKNAPNGVAGLDELGKLANAGFVVQSIRNDEFQSVTSNVNFAWLDTPTSPFKLVVEKTGKYLAFAFCGADGSGNNTLLNMSIGIGATSQNGTNVQHRGKKESTLSINAVELDLVEGDVINANVSVSGGTGYYKDKGLTIVKIG